jgi:hypothetical protein
MYQLALRHDQIKSLYYLKLQRGRPMTKLLREIVDTYLASSPVDLGQGIEQAKETKRRKG